MTDQATVQSSPRTSLTPRSILSAAQHVRRHRADDIDANHPASSDHVPASSFCSRVSTPPTPRFASPQHGLSVDPERLANDLIFNFVAVFRLACRSTFSGCLPTLPSPLVPDHPSSTTPRSPFPFQPTDRFFSIPPGVFAGRAADQRHASFNVSNAVVPFDLAFSMYRL